MPRPCRLARRRRSRCLVGVQPWSPRARASLRSRSTTRHDVPRKVSKQKAEFARTSGTRWMIGGPYLDGLVLGTSGNELVVGRDGDAVDILVVCLACEIGLELHRGGGCVTRRQQRGGYVPAFERAVLAATERERRPTSHGARTHGTRMADAHSNALCFTSFEHRRQVPQANRTVLGGRDQTSATRIHVE